MFFARWTPSPAPAPAPANCSSTAATASPSPPSSPSPFWQRGIDAVFDLHQRQRGVLPGPVPGTLFCDGALFSAALPHRLRDLPRTQIGMTSAQKTACHAAFDPRRHYAFSPHGARDPDRGTQRFKGPALAGRLRCPNTPTSLRLPISLPTSSCPPGQPCGCGITITLGPGQQPRERQPALWHTTDWAASYARRVAVESSNAELKTHRATLHRGHTRVFGRIKNALLLAFTAAGVNIRLLRAWHAKRDQPDPWTVQLHEPQPAPPPAPPHPRRRRTGRRKPLHRLIAQHRRTRSPA